MLLKALDLLRMIGWGIISFIFSLIDSLFEIIKELNAFDIINTMAKNTIFRNLHSSIIAIAIALFGLFAIWAFVKKVLEPDEGLSASKIVKEIFKCGVFIILSTFLFSQVATFSIQLSGFTANIFKNNNTKLSDSMLELYVDYSDSYLASNDNNVDQSVITKAIKDKSFTSAKKYNDKFVTNSKFILPDEKDYIYKVNWIMAILIGGFFLYALFFSGMMLARRQIEFLFLFLISPIVYATSIGNKQRRSAVIEQLVSLVLQSAVVMLIINITALVMQSVNVTTFFSNDFQNIIVKSLMFIGCGSFLLTGSQVVNRFIGGNVSANSGREQMMSLMGFGKTASTITSVAGQAVGGAGMFGLGAVAKGAGVIGTGGAGGFSKIGDTLNNFGSKISNMAGNGSHVANIGNAISNFGSNMHDKAQSRLETKNKDGLSIPTKASSLSNFGGRMMNHGKENIASAIDTIVPLNNPYRRRTRYRE